MEENNDFETNELIDEIENYKEDYYSKNSKNMIFKKSQKNELAQEISSQFDITRLLNSTAFQIKNTENIYFDYTVFKLFANDTNYNYIIQHVMNLFNNCIVHFNRIVVHVNLDTFSVSAAERYKNIIILFNQACVSTESDYETKIPNWYIYNTPNVLNMIHRLLKNIIDPNIIKKATMYPKYQSPRLLKELFG